jgi:hypothetical protein
VVDEYLPHPQPFPASEEGGAKPNAGYSLITLAKIKIQLEK